MADKEISQAVIARLPRYFRYLGELKDDGVERISSRELSRLMNITASQIRQDFNNFGGFGQQGYGYTEIAKILGLDRTHHLIIIGAGNLGQALANYVDFGRKGFLVTGIFDVNPALYGRRIRGVEVRPMEEMARFVREHNVDIAVLTVPKAAAVGVAGQLVKVGISAIWNFAHVDLDVPGEVQVENVHLSDSLIRLSYLLNSRGTESGDEKEGSCEKSAR